MIDPNAMIVIGWAIKAALLLYGVALIGSAYCDYMEGKQHD